MVNAPELTSCPRVESLRQDPMVVLEKRPVEKGLVGHLNDSEIHRLIPFENRRFFRHKGVIGAMKVLRLHANRLGLCFRFDSLID